MNPINSFLSLLAPHTCVVCHREGSIICDDCMDDIDELPSICYACGKATRANRPCDAHVSAIHPQHFWMRGKYSGHAKALLHAYKFEEKRDAAKVMAKTMETLLPYYAAPPLVTFVPTASRHRRARGFDHAELLAKEIARLRGWHYVRSLYRSGQVRQLGADRQTRKQQLKNVFSPAGTSLINGKHILVIDDVVTTGATIEACTAVLKKAGAVQVDALVFARTMEK